MDNKLVLNKVINVITNTEYVINKTFNVSNIYKFLNKFATNNNDSMYLLYITYNDKKLNYLVAYDVDKENIVIYTIDEYDIIIYETLVRKNDTDTRINNIINNTTTLLNRQNIKLSSGQKNTFKQKLLDLNNDKELNTTFINNFNREINKNIANEVYKYNKENNSNDQEGGILIKLLEDVFDALPTPIPGILLTCVLEFIDFVLMILSAIPFIGTPFDILSFIFAILRGDFALIIPILVGLIPIVGDMIGTVMKVVAKFTRITGKIGKYAAKFSKKIKINKGQKKKKSKKKIENIEVTNNNNEEEEVAN
jgi:hypothetical protein